MTKYFKSGIYLLLLVCFFNESAKADEVKDALAIKVC